MSIERKFSEVAWDRNLELYRKTLKLPFNEELRLGTLGTEKFRHYIIQDTKYLEEYSKVFALAASKAKDSKQVVYLAGIAQDIALVEGRLHSHYFKEFNVSDEEYRKTETSPACHHYTSFLMAIAYKAPLSIILASLLPCFWIYDEVGKSIKANSAPDNIFHRWIDQYGSEEFGKSTREMIAIVDELAENETTEILEQMHQAYTDSARLEYMFWDSAYQLEKWIS